MNKEEILIALKEIHARYCIPASEQNYTDKDYACMQYEKLTIHLQNEIDRLNKEYERIYNENCKLRENHNINDITLLDENERLNNIIKELSKDVDMWNKKYNEQFNIINELENFINNEIFTSLDKKHVFNEEADTFYKVLDKLKALKENNK